MSGLIGQQQLQKPTGIGAATTAAPTGWGTPSQTIGDVNTHLADIYKNRAQQYQTQGLSLASNLNSAMADKLNAANGPAAYRGAADPSMPVTGPVNTDPRIQAFHPAGTAGEVSAALGAGGGGGFNMPDFVPGFDGAVNGRPNNTEYNGGGDPLHQVSGTIANNPADYINQIGSPDPGYPAVKYTKGDWTEDKAPLPVAGAGSDPFAGNSLTTPHGTIDLSKMGIGDLFPGLFKTQQASEDTRYNQAPQADAVDPTNPPQTADEVPGYYHQENGQWVPYRGSPADNGHALDENYADTAFDSSGKYTGPDLSGRAPTAPAGNNTFANQASPSTTASDLFRNMVRNRHSTNRLPSGDPRRLLYAGG